MKELHNLIEQVEEKIDARNSNREIECSSCEESHKIRELKAIQTHWYTSPSGCTGGDYWTEGELQYVCPENDVRNRLLFRNYDVSHEERKHFKNNPEKQFSSMYKGLFKEVEDNHDEPFSEGHVNNFYVDKNRKKFGLVEKKE